MNALVIEQSLLQSHFLVGNLVFGHILNKHKEREMRGGTFTNTPTSFCKPISSGKVKKLPPTTVAPSSVQSSLRNWLVRTFAGTMCVHREHGRVVINSVHLPRGSEGTWREASLRSTWGLA